MSNKPEYCEHHMCIKAGGFVEVQECLRCQIDDLQQQLAEERKEIQRILRHLNAAIEGTIYISEREQ